MNKSTDFFVILATVIGFIAGYFSKIEHKKTTTTDHVQYYNGEILAPDMVHDDSLIVVNAAKLNRIFNSDHAPASDGDISAALYDNCIVPNRFSNGLNELGNNLLHEYQLEIVEDTILMYDRGRFVGTFHWEDAEPIGQLLLKDNQ